MRCCRGSASRRARRSSIPGSTRRSRRRSRRVEARNFEIRKNLLKYDNVMNDQRKVIYEQRKELMRSNDVSDEIADMRHEVVEDLVAQVHPGKCLCRAVGRQGAARGMPAASSISISAIAEWVKEEGIDDTQIRERIIEAADRKMAEKAANYGPEMHAHGREEHAAQHPRPVMERASGGARLSAAGHRPARLRPARSAQRVQARGLRHVPSACWCACASR